MFFVALSTTIATTMAQFMLTTESMDYAFDMGLVVSMRAFVRSKFPSSRSHLCELLSLSQTFFVLLFFWNHDDH